MSFIKKLIEKATLRNNDRPEDDTHAPAHDEPAAEQEATPSHTEAMPASTDDTPAQTDPQPEAEKQEQEVYFEDLALSDDVLDALYDMRFEKCTPVQAKCIPPILEERDVLGVAQTGTGKTAAYLLPLLTLLREKPHPDDAVNCLVVAPTRELARQIDQALQGFSYYTNVNAVAVYGGNDGIRFEQERKSLMSGADIVLATPGRLITHLQLGHLDLSHTTHLVLDEADRMLDMGFSEDIMTIVKHMPAERQTILFSATMPPRIAELARHIMHNPVEIEIAVSKPADNISQSVYVCREGDKSTVLRYLFKQQPPKRVILFCSSKQKVKELAIVLQRRGFNARAMHSDLDQSERDEVINLFRASQIDLMVATDIVARGLDIDDITTVINYDAPHDAEDYVHRIGRTARAGKDGCAVTLIGEKDLFRLAQIERVLKIKIPRAELPEGVMPPDRAARDNHKRSTRHDGKAKGKHSPKTEDKAQRSDPTKRTHSKPRKPRQSPEAAQDATATQTPQAATPSAAQKESRSRSSRHRRKPRPKKAQTAEAAPKTTAE